MHPIGFRLATQNRAGVEQTPVADHNPLAHNYIRVQNTVFTNLAASADKDPWIQNCSSSDHCPRTHKNKWRYCHARIDLCIVGGLTEARKVSGWCETHSIQIAPHNPLGPVSTAACLHLDLATSNFGVQECARVPGSVLPDLFPVQVPFESGYLLPPDRPGLGVEIDEDAVVNYPPIEDGDAPRLERPDGSFTNW